MTKLSEAPQTSFLGFRFWLDDALQQTASLVPSWIGPADVTLLPLSDAERAEHLPYQMVRHQNLLEVLRWSLEQRFLEAGFTPAQMASDEVARLFEIMMPQEIATWALWQPRNPSERNRRAWSAAAIYFAFGKGNRHEAARMCNYGLPRADEESGIEADVIRDALYHLARRANPISARFRFRLQIEVCAALAARQLWSDLADGKESVSGRRRFEIAKLWKRSGDLYQRFHEHFCAASPDPFSLGQYAIELGKLTLKLRGERLIALDQTASDYAGPRTSSFARTIVRR